MKARSRSHAGTTSTTRSSDDRMTAEQAARLKALSIQAYEPEAFSETLSRAEAERRIAVLSAKLPLLDGPPHTL
ncbi:MAG TPA: DUF3072 domain-containing protein [Pseudolabrys sp.]|nr:DUF3072 domain-containing protein [Pseudolabrys sp.]